MNSKKRRDSAKRLPSKSADDFGFSLIYSDAQNDKISKFISAFWFFVNFTKVHLKIK